MQNSCLKTSAWWSLSSHFVENGYSLTKISKYGQNEWWQALNASYMFQPLMGFWCYSVNFAWDVTCTLNSIAVVSEQPFWLFPTFHVMLLADQKAVTGEKSWAWITDFLSIDDHFININLVNFSLDCVFK